MINALHIPNTDSFGSIIYRNGTELKIIMEINNKESHAQIMPLINYNFACWTIHRKRTNFICFSNDWSINSGVMTTMCPSFEIINPHMDRLEFAWLHSIHSIKMDKWSSSSNNLHEWIFALFHNRVVFFTVFGCPVTSAQHVFAHYASIYCLFSWCFYVFVLFFQAE